MSKKRLYLHIGTHKTGTTSIQRFLADQATDLRAAGCGVFSHDGRTNAFALAHAFIRPNLVTPMRISQHRDLDIPLSVFASELERDTLSSMIVSTEAFCFVRTDAEMSRIQSFLRPLFDEIIPLVVLRDVKSWKASWMRQLEKMQVLETILRQPPGDRVVDGWYFDHARLVSLWNQLGKTRVIGYGDAMENDASVLPAFLKVADLDKVMPRKAYCENVSL